MLWAANYQLLTLGLQLAGNKMRPVDDRHCARGLHSHSFRIALSCSSFCCYSWRSVSYIARLASTCLLSVVSQWSFFKKKRRRNWADEGTRVRHQLENWVESETEMQAAELDLKCHPLPFHLIRHHYRTPRLKVPLGYVIIHISAWAGPSGIQTVHNWASFLLSES